MLQGRNGVMLTRPSARDSSISRLVPTFLATALINKGSNRAESSSFATVRAIFTPSFIPGGLRAPPENACATASFSLFDDRETYRDSKLDRARKTRTVSGLQADWSAWELFECNRQAPLICLGVDSVCMHSDFGEKPMEEAEQARIAGAESLL
jgi:hypothetical protein